MDAHETNHAVRSKALPTAGPSPDERRRLKLCRLIAYSAPAAAAAVTVGVFVGHGLSRLGPMGQPVEVAILAANAAAGVAAAVSGVVWYYPAPARRWRAGAVTAIVSPFVYVLAYAAFGTALMSLRLFGINL